MRDPGEVAAQQSYIARFDGHIGARSHGESGVGLRQCGRVVDSVAHHRHHPAVALQSPDLGDFSLRQDARDNSLNTRFARDLFRGFATIARQQNAIETQALEFADRFYHAGAQRIGHSEGSRHFPVHRDRKCRRRWM